MYDCAVILLCGGAISKDNLWRSVARIDLAVKQHLSIANSCLSIASGVAGSNFLSAIPESHIYLAELTRLYT